jgi:hypothetical protein
VVERCLPGGHDLGLVAEAQIVVGRKHDDFAPSFHPDAGRLGALDVVQVLVNPVATKLVELCLDAGIERIS